MIEASGKLPGEALQAAFADVRHGFNMNKTTLVKLDEAGVPDGVIDLMVALTFPSASSSNAPAAARRSACRPAWAGTIRSCRR